MLGLLAFCVPSMAQESSTAPVTSANERGWLGFKFTVLDDGRLDVAVLVPGGAAETAGLETGDIVTEIDGVACDFASREEVAQALSGVRAGQIVTLTVERGEQGLELPVEAAPLAPELAEAQRRAAAETGDAMARVLRSIVGALAEGPLAVILTRRGDTLRAEPERPLDVPPEALAAFLAQGLADSVEALEPGESLEVTVEREGSRLAIRAE